MERFRYLIEVVALSSCISLLSGCEHHDTTTQAPPAKVEVTVIGSDTHAGNVGTQSYSGTVVSAEEALVSFSVPGNITNIYVKEGQKVAKGQLLAKVKSETLNDERNIAAAELDQVRDLYRRLKILHDQNALPDVKWVEVQTRLKQAENAVAIADKAVNDASLTSPISGYVAEKLADEGQSVLPAQPILKLVNVDNLQIAISVPEEDINRYGSNATADVAFDALGSMKVKGKLASKDMVADPLTRSYRIKFDIPDGGGKILPGMIGSVNVCACDSAYAAQEGSVIVIPSQAVLLSADNRQFVWVVKDGKAARKYVTASELRSEGVAVSSGLAPGDSLIVAGMQKVSSGTEVTPIL